MRTSSSIPDFDAETAGPSRRFWTAIRSAWQAYCKWYQRRAVQHYLSELDDRMLKDIGISRSQIEAAVSRGRPWTR